MLYVLSQEMLMKTERCSLGTGTAVSINGTWQPAPPGKEQKYELKAKEVKIVGQVDAEVDNYYTFDLQ